MGWVASVPLLVAALAFGGAGAVRAASDDDAAANRLLVEAVGLVERAEATVPPGDRAALYGRAIDNLDEIAARHPESDLAARLAAGQQVGEIDRRALERQRRLSVAAGCIAEMDRSCLLALALEMSPTIDDVYERSWAVALIAAGQADAGAVEQALETANAVIFLSDRVWALGAIAAAMSRAGNGEEARQMIDDAVATANAIEHTYTGSLALGRVAVWQAEVGDTAGARQTNQRALELAIQLGGLYNRTILLGPIAKAQTKIGDAAMGRLTLAHAIELALQVSYPDGRIQALGRIASLQAETGNTAGARETINRAIDLIDSIRLRVDSIVFGWSRDEPLAKIAGAQASVGNLEQAHNTAVRIDSPYWRATAIADIAEAHLKAGDIAEARRFVELSFEAIKKIDSRSETALSLVRLMRALQ